MACSSAGLLGVTVSGFPNLFMQYGPNTHLGMIEAQADYTLGPMKKNAGVRCAQPRGKTSPVRAIQSRVAADLEKSVRSTAGASWWQARGRHHHQQLAARHHALQACARG